MRRIYTRSSSTVADISERLAQLFSAWFFEDMHEVHLHGADGDRERVSDLLVFHPTADQGDDFILARGEPGEVAAIQESHHLIGNGIFDPDVAAAHGAQTFDDG